MDLTVSINSTATHHEMTHSKICSRVTEDSQREESWLMMEKKKKKKKKKKLSKDFWCIFQDTEFKKPTPTS